MADESKQLKRRIDDDSDSEVSLKKFCLDLDDENRESFAKLLLPSFIAGLIIGKDGVEISSLMSKTNTMIKFSPGRELYPDTQDRVCCLTGTINNIVEAVQGIFDKIKASDHIHDTDLLKTIKMLISNVASGIIIGKSGANIRTIQKAHDVRIQISGKEETRGLPERTMVILADSSKCIISAVKAILIQLLNDPDAEKWKKLLTYSGYASNSTTPTITPQTTPTNSVYSLMSLMQQQQQQQSQYQQNYLQQATSNILGRGSQLSSPSTSFYQRQGSNTSSSTNNDTTSSPELTQTLLSYMYSQSLISNSSYFTRFSPVMIHGVNMTVPGATLATFEISIPDVMVSVVLGVSGALLSELMHSTGTHIELSPKGDYIPGTYNRKLTITGPILSVLSAHLTISQSIIREQEAFRKQGLI